MSELVERLRRFADIEDSGGSCDLQFETSPSREAADCIEDLEARLEKAEAERDRQHDENVHRITMQAKAENALDTARNDAFEEAESAARQALIDAAFHYQGKAKDTRPAIFSTETHVTLAIRALKEPK